MKKTWIDAKVVELDVLETKGGSIKGNEKDNGNHGNADKNPVLNPSTPVSPNT